MPNPPSALLIIDMQKGMQSTTLPRRNNLGAEVNIRKLLAQWRASDLPIVHVRHVSRSADSVFAPGQIGAEFQDALSPLASEHIVEKNVTDAFTHSGLERWLHVRGIRDVVIVGVSTNQSVESTARSSGNLGFRTRVVSDATFTFDRVGLDGVLQTAQDVHMMSLTNLSGEYAQVVATLDLVG